MNPPTPPHDKSQSSERATALLETLFAIFAMGDTDPAHLTAAVTKFPPEDVAEILSDFSDERKVEIFHALADDEARSIVLEETDPQSRHDILEEISEAERIRVLGEMPVDDLADHMEGLSAEERTRVLATLEPDEARAVEQILEFPPETAGGMMTTEFISIPQKMSSKEALDKIQGNLDVEVISYVYATAPDDTLQGVVSIRDILRAQPSVPVEEYMTRDVISLPLLMDREEVATTANRHNLSVLPVVDAEGRMRGLVTIDDVFDAVEEEHSEDMLRMAGTVAIHPYYEPVYLGVAKRLPFLIVTTLGGFGVLTVKTLFQDEIDNTLLTAALGVIPLLSGLSGNVATVAATVMVRGIATGQISIARAGKAVGQEMTIGIIIGLVLSLAVAVTLSIFWPEDFGLRTAWVVAFSLACSVAWAAFVGAIIPIGCRLSGWIDPAIVSGPFVTVLCDLSASSIYLSLVYVLLSQG